jgi:predicted nucleotidyltransferase
MNLRNRWSDIFRLSKSKDEFERTTALATAVGALEVALTALGVPRDPRQGFQRRLDESQLLSRLKSAPATPDLRPAIAARNNAIHAHKVPDPKRCRAYIQTLHDVWSALRGLYVTRDRAADFAKRLLGMDIISDVFLFGSLARGHRTPKDIDLLLYDDGELSSVSRGYGWIAESVLDEFFRDDAAVEAAVRLGWLDCVVIDGTRFGDDKKYTLAVAKQQTDPLFFVNISDALLRYDTRRTAWIKKSPRIFQRLATIRAQLATENVIRSHR